MKVNLNFCSTSALIFLGLLQGCLSDGNSEGVTVTIEPQKYFVDRLTSENIEVNVMVPMGSSPATYSPTAGQFAKLSASKSYIMVGHLGFEQAWMKRMTALNPEMGILNLSDNVALIKGDGNQHGDHEHEGGIDPHIWMSPKVVRNFMPQLSETLIKEFPDFEDQIVRNYASFLEDVDSIDAVFSDLCSGLKHQKFMIFHPALAYLGRDYGLEQISIEYEGKEPSPMKLKEVIDLAREENIRVIFIQAEFDQRSADIVREATGAELVTINPLAYDWMESMNEVFLMFEKHLK